MTFSLTAHCARTGMCGVAVTSSSICVAARCAHARARAGAVATQNITNPALGVSGLELLAAGRDARDTLAKLLAGEAHAQYRQIAVVDARGGAVCHSGAGTLGRHAQALGDGCVAAGNLLADEAVPGAMLEAFAAAPEEHLAERLLRALEAGLAAGGEAGPVRSAGLLVAHQVSWPVVDLRVDWSDAPIAALRELWQAYRPQLDDYVTRALDPRSAPAFGVPGDP